MTSGVLVVDKPKGMTSFDVCRQVRRIFKTKKVGHTGTLDPDATGVLPVCVNQATRLVQYLTASRKVYRTRMVFGYETDSQDVSGQVLARAPLPDIDAAAFQAVVASYLGPIRQEVNPYSAIKVDGRPLYDYVRKGDPIPDLPDRKAMIYDIQVLAFGPEAAELRAEVGPGTYIRTLVRDIGRSAGTLATMADLRRELSGGFDLSEACRLEDLEATSDPSRFLIPMADALRGMPRYDIDDAQARDIQFGRAIQLEEEGEGLAGLVWQGSLLALGQVEGNGFQPRQVFHMEGDQ